MPLMSRGRGALLARAGSGAGKSKIPTCVSAGGDLCSPAKGYVARGGVEPPTFRFSVGRSYQLSYLAVSLGSCYPATGRTGGKATCSDTQNAARGAASALRS